MRFAFVSENKNEYSNSCADIDYVKSGTAVTEEDWSNYDAVFLVEPYSEKDVEVWTGHPHLKCCGSIVDFSEEINIIQANLEIEKKYLIEMPDIASLEKYKPYASDIEQIYLLSDAGTHRIRKRVMKSKTQYIETLKIRISGSTCNEYEGLIDEKEYNELKTKADPDKHPIIKTRYCFVYLNQYFELDIYDFWKNRATLEIELKDDNQKVIIPPEIKIIKDVTNDYEYKNNSLAGVKYEDY